MEFHVGGPFVHFACTLILREVHEQLHQKMTEVVRQLEWRDYKIDVMLRSCAQPLSYGVISLSYFPTLIFFQGTTAGFVRVKA